jgi:hypothetical protein
MTKQIKKKESEKDLNKTVSGALLDSYRKALMKVKDFFDSVDDMKFDQDNIGESMKLVSSVLSAGEKLGKNIETLAILEKKVAAEEQMGSKIRGGAKLSLLENEDI